MVKVVEKSLLEHGDIMPLDVDSLRSKENIKIIIYPDTSSDNEISQSSEFRDLKYVKKFADKTNEKRNITENPVKIKIDVIRQERKIEVRKEIEKSNDSITDQLKPNNDKIIPEKKQNIDDQQTFKFGSIPTKKSRRRKKKPKKVVLLSSDKEEEVKKQTKRFSVPTGKRQKSRKKPILSLYYVVFHLLFSLMSCDGTHQLSEVKWKIANEIIIFGNTVLLHCKLNVGSFCNGTSTRRWTKGKRQTNLVLNGTSSDSKKYKETVDKDCNGATLYIYSFDEKDIDAYTCAHDFDEYTDTIKLHEIKYRSYPDVRKIKTELQCNNQKLLWTFDLLDIYPIATCTFHTEISNIQDENGTLEGRTHNSSGSLLSSEYRLNCTLQGGNCKGVIHVLCCIDDKIIDINNRTYDCCEDFKRNAEKEDVNFSFIPVVLVVTVVSVVFVVVGILLFCKGKVNCQKIFKNDNEFLDVGNEQKLLDQNNSEQVVNKKVDPVYGSDELLKVQIDSQKGDYGTTE